jgi:hypothetical protein
VAQAELLLLPDGHDARLPGDPPDLLGEVLLPGGLELGLEQRRTIEVVDHRGFSAGGDEDDLGDAGLDRLGDHVGDTRAIEER